MNLAADLPLIPLIAAVLAAAAWIMLATRTKRQGDPKAAAAASDRPSGERARWIRLAIGLALGAMIWSLTDRPGIGLAVVTLWIGALAVLRSMERQRQAEQEERHAIEAIGAAGRALRAGIPVGGMIDFLATESRGEAARAFREIVRREGVGESMSSAIRTVLLGSRMPALRAFGLAVLAQLGAGGDIADTTDRLARSLIERNRMRRRVRAVMAYTRAAAILLAVLPAILVPLLCVLMPDYAQFMLHRPAGNALLAIAAAMVVVGTLLMQRMSRIEPARGGAAR
jgi:tight adherence protein B